MVWPLQAKPEPVSMNILFWGTPDYAVPTLVALHQAGHTLVGVVTQPDRRRGRGKTLVPSAVKAKALEMGLKVFTPERIKQDQTCQQKLAELQPDLSVVVAFGQILPKSVLNQPPLGCWNGHGSLLPRWRGAGPIQWSLLEGDTETGVGVMAMEEGLDTGPVLIERKLPIGLLDNGHTLAKRMSVLTADLMVEAMPLIESAGHGSEHERRDRLKVMDQADRPGEASYARMLTKQDHQIDWSDSALTIHRKVMALYPNAVTLWNDKRLKIQHCEPLIERLKDELPADVHPLVGRWPTGGHPPGTVLESVKGVGVVVSTKGCPIMIRSAQLEGKGRSDGDSLIQQLNATAKQQFGTFP
jgi:methionyl-tRNA formyltransferase